MFSTVIVVAAWTAVPGRFHQLDRNTDAIDSHGLGTEHPDVFVLQDRQGYTPAHWPTPAFGPETAAPGGLAVLELFVMVPPNSSRRFLGDQH